VEKTSNITEQARPHLWTLNFTLVCLSNLILCMIFHGLNVTLPLYIEQFGGTVKIAGLALTSLTFAAIISRPVTGWSLDKYGRKLFFIGGLILFLLSTITYIWMIPVHMLILIRFFQGLGWGMCHTALSTVALDIVPHGRMGEGMGFYSLFTSVSMAWSPALALWLINQHSFRELFIVVSFLTLGLLASALFIRYPKIEKQITAPKFELVEKMALRPSFVIFLVTFSYSAVISFLALYALNQGLKTAGYFFTVMAITALISRPSSGFIIDRAGQKGFALCVMIGTISMVMAIIFLVITSISLHLVIAGLLYGVGNGFLQPIMLILSVRSAPPEKKGSANATYWTAVDLATALGSLFWGFVAAAFGYKVMFSMTIIPVVIALTIYFCNTSSNDIVLTKSGGS